MPYGDLGKRFVAWLLDNIFLSVISSIIYGVIWNNTYAPFTIIYTGLPVVAVVTFLYYVLQEGSAWHGTLGKMIMGLYISNENGEGISYATSILRMLGKALSGVMFGLGYIMCLFSEEKQCLHDMLAKTYVLNANERFSVQKFNVRGANRNKALNGANANKYGDVPQLVGASGPLAGMIYGVDSSGVVIGRDTVSCNVVVPASQKKVSRVHCFLTYNPISGVFVLNDRNSTHGTYLSNGKKIPYSHPVTLNSGDRFYIATPDNMFEVR